MLCNNPKLDLVNMNANIKFGEILPFGSQDIDAYIKFGDNMSNCSQGNEQKFWRKYRAITLVQIW